MLVEPTETESKRSLDQFIAALRSIAEGQGWRRDLKAAPVHARGGGSTKRWQQGSRCWPTRRRRRTARRRGWGAFRRRLMAEPSFPPYNVGDLGHGSSQGLGLPGATSGRSATCSRTGCRIMALSSKSPAGPANMRWRSPGAFRRSIGNRPIPIRKRWLRSWPGGEGPANLRPPIELM